MQENEGQILFAVDRQSKGRRQINEQDTLRQSIIHGYNTYRVMSSLNLLLNYLKEAWQAKHGNLDVAKMCMYLADNDISWLSNQTNIAKDWLNSLDQEILALLEEGNAETISPDVLQEIMAGSLAFLQLESSKNSDVAKQELFDFLNARAIHIFKNLPERAKRKKYYRLGLPLEDCKTVEVHEKELGELLSSAQAFQDWNEDQRCEYLEKLAEFVLTQIGELSPRKSEAMKCWKVILGMWLHGDSPNEIVQNIEVAKFTDDAAEVSAFIEDAFVYKLPRGLNALTSFFADVSEETGFNLPQVVSYFSALVKYGVYDPVASCLLAFNITSRKLSLRLAQVYSDATLEPRQILSWFLNLDPNHLQSHGFLPDEIDVIESAKKWSSSLRHERSIQTETVKMQIIVDSQNAAKVSDGDVVLIHPHEDVSLRQVALETLRGEIVGYIKLKSSIPPDWYFPHRVCTFLERKQTIDDKKTQLDIRILMF